MAGVPRLRRRPLEGRLRRALLDALTNPAAADATPLDQIFDRLVAQARAGDPNARQEIFDLLESGDEPQPIRQIVTGVPRCPGRHGN